MSGTSLDGLDLALCNFRKENEVFHYKILQAQTFSYPPDLSQKLKELYYGNALFFCQIEVAFSIFIAQCVNQFLVSSATKPDYIALHGHTVFHQPEVGLTKQIGSGAILSAKTGISTICDFRTTDVALGGQGAPLVPVGDRFLFSEYAACLNLGGIANISYNNNGTRIAYDISLCNIVLNYLATQQTLPYDDKGALAKKGSIHKKLLDDMNRPDFFAQHSVKSIGFEFFEKYYKPLLENYTISVEDKLRTMCEHVATQITYRLKGLPNVLVTGGGAKNNFLIHLVKEKTKTKIIIPDEQLVDFKEALVFAFLGYLRIHEIANCLCSVTGATKDLCCGGIYKGAN
jgi:anhydro-N-acetylmuramic acid kinase